MTVNHDRPSGAAALDGGDATDAADPVDDAGLGRSADASEAADGRSVRAAQRREQRRSEIIAAATVVFREKGYHAASIGDIIDAAAIARGTFYLYFNSKREIFTELTGEFLGLIRGSVRTISLEPGSPQPIEQMRANFRRVMSTVIAHEDLAMIMLSEPGDLDAESRALMDGFFGQIIALIERAVSVGRALGFARDCDDHIIAVSALGALCEVLRRMLRARQEPEGAGEASLVDTERLADELVTFFVRGVFT